MQLCESTNNPVDSMNWRELQKAVAECRECRLCQSRTQPVFGEGAMNPPIMFIGEGPGCHEDQSGRPFVGRAGKLLDRMIQAMQFEREQVYIGNIVKCRPPGNRNPQDNESRACLPYLNRQIKLLQPRILILLGSVPLNFLLGLTGITKVHGTFHEYHGIPATATYHPSYLLRAQTRKQEAWDDLQKVMHRLGKDPARTREFFHRKKQADTKK